MRPLAIPVHLPVPVGLWVLLLGGHGLAAVASVPAALEGPARIAAVALAAGSLAATRGVERRGRRAARRLVLERAASGAALLCCGAALGGEADRAAWPLPVHPAGAHVVVEGEILDTTSIDAAPPSVLVEARRVRVGLTEASCRARLLLQWTGGASPDWAYPGLTLRVEGTFRPPEDARNPGSTAPGRWLARRGVEGTIAVDPRTAELTAGDGARPRPAGIVRHHLARLLSRDLSPATAALARGMLLGDRAGLDASVRDAFRDAGTIHILSISGLHVCLLAAILALVTAALRLPDVVAMAVELGTLWGYVALVGAPAPASRSALLWSALRAGRMAGRAVRPITGWGLAGLLLHLGDPGSLEDPGFMLSFAAALGLIAAGGLGSGRSAGPTGVRGRSGKTLRRLARAAASTRALAAQSAGAEAATLGIQVKLFGAVPIAGLVINLAVVPLCALFMAEALLYLASAPFGAALADVAAGPVEISGLGLIAISRWGAGAMPPWPVRSEPGAMGVIGGLAAILMAALWRERCRGDRDRSWRSRLVVPAAALGVASILPAAGLRPVERGRAPRALFLDVGQGDAAIASVPGGQAVLFDAGPSEGARDAGRIAIEPALRAEGGTGLALAVLSHAHRDHYGGLPWLARRGWVRHVVENGRDASGAWRGPIEAGLRASGGRFAPIAGESTITLGPGATLDVFGAESRWPGRGGGPSGENDHSLVARLRVDGRTVLFAGDVEEAGERALSGRLTSVDVLKVPHHGSRTSSTPEWVRLLRPRIAIISCGERNRFGHPDPAAIGRYLRAGARVFRTDRDGAIRATLAPEGIWISTRRDPQPELIRLDPTGLSPSPADNPLESVLPEMLYVDR